MKPAFASQKPDQLGYVYRSGILGTGYYLENTDDDNNNSNKNNNYNIDDDLNAENNTDFERLINYMRKLYLYEFGETKEINVPEIKHKVYEDFDRVLTDVDTTKQDITSLGIASKNANVNDHIYMLNSSVNSYINNNSCTEVENSNSQITHIQIPILHTYTQSSTQSTTVCAAIIRLIGLVESYVNELKGELDTPMFTEFDISAQQKTKELRTNLKELAETMINNIPTQQNDDDEAPTFSAFDFYENGMRFSKLLTDFIYEIWSELTNGEEALRCEHLHTLKDKKESLSVFCNNMKSQLEDFRQAYTNIHANIDTHKTKCKDICDGRSQTLKGFMEKKKIIDQHSKDEREEIAAEIRRNFDKYLQLLKDEQERDIELQKLQSESDIALRKYESCENMLNEEQNNIGIITDSVDKILSSNYLDNIKDVFELKRQFAQSDTTESLTHLLSDIRKSCHQLRTSKDAHDTFIGYLIADKRLKKEQARITCQSAGQKASILSAAHSHECKKLQKEAERFYKAMKAIEKDVTKLEKYQEDVHSCIDGCESLLGTFTDGFDANNDMCLNDIAEQASNKLKMGESTNMMVHIADNPQSKLDHSDADERMDWLCTVKDIIPTFPTQQANPLFSGTTSLIDVASRELLQSEGFDNFTVASYDIVSDTYMKIKNQFEENNEENNE